MAHGCTYCTDDFHCEKFTNEKYTSWCYGKDYPCKDRRISNADRIRAMSDEELEAEFWRIYEELRRWTNSRIWLHQWLKEEVKE